MKISHEFRFFTDRFYAIPDAPKGLVTKTSSIVTTIEIDQEHQKFKQLVQWAKKNEIAHMGPGPTPKYFYTEDELKGFEIFYLSFISPAPAEIDSIDYGTKYRTIKSCERPDRDKKITPPAPDAPFWEFGTYRQAQIRQREPFKIQEQISPLFTDTNKLSKTIDFQQLRSDEVLINKRLADILTEHHIQGYEVKPVFRPKRIHRWGDDVEVKNSEGVQSPNWFHLVITATAGPVQPLTIFGPDYIDLTESKTGTYQVKECDLISDPKFGSSLYFKRKEWPKTDLVRTKELRIAEIPYPFILITQKLYRIFKKNKVKGLLEVRPAYFVD